MSPRILALVAVLLIAAVPSASRPAAAQTARVSVLVDFGDGTYLWGDVEVPDTNRTALKATELANASWGLVPLNVSWFASPFCLRSPCAFVNDIGDRRPAYPIWWHFFLWNQTTRGWDAAAYGPSDTAVGEADAIAWYLAVDDPATYASPRPAPKPDFRDVWTSFRSDLANSGRARGAIPVTNHLLWDRDIGILEIDTTPVVANGRVYVATRDALVALNAETGQEVWRNPQIHDLLSTPAVYDGRLILGGTDGRLHLVNAANGTEEWSVPIEPGARSTGIASSPAVYMGRAYVGTFNESAGGKGRVVAVNLNNGTVAWATDAPGVIHMSTPAIAGGALYVGIMGTYDGVIGYTAPHGLLSLALNGTPRWFFQTNASVASSPVVHGSLVYVTTYEGWVYAIEDTGRLVWSAWTAPSSSSPAFVDGALYVGAGSFNGTGGWIFRLDDIGSPVWWAGGNGPFQASLVSDGRLVCGATNTASGTVTCVAASTGAEVWTFVPSPRQFILGSPAVVGTTMYAPSDNGHVYAFRDANPRDHPLVGLELTAPSEVRSGDAVQVQLRARNLGNGSASGVTVVLTLPAGLQTAGETPDDATQDRARTYDFGDLATGESGGDIIAGVILTGYEVVNITASLRYSDAAGRPYGPVIASALLTVRTFRPADAPWGLVGGVLVATALGVAATVFLLRRRRRAGPDG